MMYSEDMNEALERSYFELADPAWVAGAAAGLAAVGDRCPRRLWSPFINQVYYMIDLLEGVEPVEPGSALSEGETVLGSALDVLGGYVSVTGVVMKDGLYFRVDLDRIDDVQSLLQEMGEARPGGLLIRWDNMESFLMLVHLAGPVEESLMEAAK